MTDKLLVLDDEPDFASFVRQVAESAGLEVTVITDPADFKDVYRQFAPQRIVLDVVMPGMDGIEIMKWLGSVGNTANVILVSGYSPHYVEAAKLMAGAESSFSVRTLTKPLSASELSLALTS